MFDSGVGEVLQPHHERVLLASAKLIPDADMIAKIELGTEPFMASSIQRYDVIGAYPDL